MTPPDGTAVYLVLYVATWLVHVALIGHVLTGTAWLAVRAALGKDDDALAATFRDRLPFMLGAAITAGVAPLLFVQVLYQERFYTANLLLSHRWMAVVPALIVGFYALYAAKTARVAAWPARWRAAVPGVATACFVFVAYSWTENHLLTLRPDRWATMYGEGAVVHVEAQLVPRVAMWLGLALPVGATIAAWAVRDDAGALRQLRAAALAGLAVAVAAGGVMVASWEPATAPRRGVAGVMLWGALGPALVLAVLWAVLPRARRRRLTLGAASFAALVVLVHVALFREAYRWDALAAARPRVAAAGGMAAFFAVFVANAAVIAWLIRGARRALRPAP